MRRKRGKKRVILRLYIIITAYYTLVILSQHCVVLI